ERDRGDGERARRLYARALAGQRARHGELHPNTAASHFGYGRLLLEHGELDAAAREIEPAIVAYRQIKGESAPATLYYERALSQLEEARGELPLARAHLARMEDAMRAFHMPAAHIVFGYVALDAGYIELALGEVERARARFADADRIFGKIQPAGHPRPAEIRLGEALAARAAGEIEEGTHMLDEAEADARRHLAPGHPLFAALAAARGRPVPDASPGLALLRVQRA